MYTGRNPPNPGPKLPTRAEIEAYEKRLREIHLETMAEEAARWPDPKERDRWNQETQRNNAGYY